MGDNTVKCMCSKVNDSHRKKNFKPCNRNKKSARHTLNFPLSYFFLLKAMKVFALFANLGLLSVGTFAVVMGTVPPVETGTGILLGETGPCDIDALVVGLSVVAVVPDVFGGSPELPRASALANLLDDLPLAPSASVHLRLIFDFLLLSPSSPSLAWEVERSAPFAGGKGEFGALNGLGESGVSLE